MIPIETVLARLGSRFCLNLRPQARCVGHGAAGRFLDEEAELAIGIDAAGMQRVLPLTPAGEVFESIHQELTATSVTYRCMSPALGFGLDVSIRAPFYPQDAETSSAPVFYFELTARRLPPAHHLVRDVAPCAEVFLGIRRPATRVTASADGLDLEYVTTIKQQEMRCGEIDRRPPTDRKWRIERIRCRERISGDGATTAGDPDALRWQLDLSDGPQTVTAQWVAHVTDPVFERGGHVYAFRAARQHASLSALANWAHEHRAELIEKSCFFDSVLADSSLGKSQLDLVAFALQSYLMNTWWVVRDDGEEWFSVWEGVCRYHSTIDVEYNISMFYLALWPELLARTIDEWADYEKSGDADGGGRPTGWLSHDVGACQNADGQDYPHEMEIEENCNFILLLHVLWRWTADDPLVSRHAALLQRLVRYIIASDTTGNGFPDRGVANTIDDASAAVQFAREQTYLAVKALCAARAAGEMADFLGDLELAGEARAFAERTITTLESDAWLGDHYAVCIDRDIAGVVDEWTGKPFAGDKVPGWDACSIYTANGALLPMMAGMDLGLDAERLRSDLSAGLREAGGEYGCTHSSADRNNLWVSQNLWRDFAAAYLGLDFLAETERYWAFQVRRNRGTPGHCFIDTHGWNCLDYYPRGITSMGLFLAGPRIIMDRKSRRVRLAASRAPARFPLLPLADWSKRAVPTVTFAIEQGRVTARLDGAGLLDTWDVTIDDTCCATPARR